MSEKSINTRREFLQKLIALSALVGVAPYADAFGEPLFDLKQGKLPKRPLAGQVIWWVFSASGARRR